MIEIVNEPRPVKDAKEREPRNIRQIGTVSGNNKIYMEDYVYRFLHRKDRRRTTCCFVLFGDVERDTWGRTIYIRGTIELTDMSFGGGLPVFSDDMWDDIYRKTRKYFPMHRIIGWGLQTAEPKEMMEREIKKISHRHFPDNYGNVFLFDAYGEWEQVYVDVEGELNPEQGYLIYYEKNAPMGNYLSDYHRSKKSENDNQIFVQDEVRYEREVRQDAEAMARYRAYMNGQNERSHVQRTKVAISIALVAMILLSGILIQNYAKLSEMKKAVTAISNQEAVEKAKDELIKETISKKATELTEDKKEETPKVEETVKPSEPEVNPYIAQGFYMVEQGDKLIDVSRKVYGNDTMVQAICEKNGIQDQDNIKAGDKLLLP